MKKFLSIIFTIILTITVLAGCRSNDTTDPASAIDESTTIETVDEIVDELTEDVSVAESTTDENGNETIIGTDKDGNTVEIKTDSDGNVTKTVTDKNTGEKTEQTTKTTVPSAVPKPGNKPVTTTKQQTTTKPATKPQTTEKQNTTKKPVAQTTAHTHNWQPVYATRKVCVKEAWTEEVTATVPVETPTYHCTCGAWFNETNCNENPKKSLTLHVINNGGPNDTHKNTNTFTMEPIPGEYETIVTGSISHPAEYKEEKYIASYKCSCGATKSA